MNEHVVLSKPRMSLASYHAGIEQVQQQHQPRLLPEDLMLAENAFRSMFTPETSSPTPQPHSNFL
jgi:hypothetical protein